MKKILIINHYAAGMYFNKGGRHYWIAKHLIDLGYEVEILCSNIRHSKNIKVETNSHISKVVDEIKFTFVSTSEYQSNGLDRIKNMYSFYANILKYKKDFEKPDIIIASSVHPLSILAGYKLSKYFQIPLISEIRDLWPESLIAYGKLKKNSIASYFLYRLENYLYTKSDSIIMTWEGGKDYILDKGWEESVDINKINFITNGIDIESFDFNSKQEFADTEIIFDESKFNIIYTGSIRAVNNLSLILDVARNLQSTPDIFIHIIGDGNEKQMLIDRIEKEELNNIKIWNAIPKNQVPSIISKADLNLLHNKSTILDKYGQSQNKLFEYLAAGKPILQTYTNKYSILEKHNAGIMCSNQNVDEIKKSILKIYNDEKIKKAFSENARNASKVYDFKVHTQKVNQIIENLI